jgi:hypothetical protein
VKDRLLAIAVLVIIEAIGFVRLVRRRSRVQSRISFASEFSERFVRYANSGASDEQLYIELTSRVSRMQREMGSYGVLGAYKPPGGAYMIKNYPLLLNALPEMRQYGTDGFLGPRFVPELAAMIRDSIIRYTSSLGEADDHAVVELRNPIVWFAEGCRFILAAPLRVLGSLGIGTGIMERIANGGTVKLLAGIIALLGAIASIVTIATGWDATKALIVGLLGR